MLTTPYIIREKLLKIDDLYEANEKFIKVYLEDINPLLIKNYIVKSILEKYPEYRELFLSLQFNESNSFNWEEPLFGTNLFKEFQEEVVNFDIIFMNYEELSKELRIEINNLIRVGFVCGSGCLLFHIQSKYTYFELLDMGYSFDTHCDQEKILIGHEIQPLYSHKGKLIDDGPFLRDSSYNDLSEDTV